MRKSEDGNGRADGEGLHSFRSGGVGLVWFGLVIGVLDIELKSEYFDS